jgi:hypothetical protein
MYETYDDGSLMIDDMAWEDGKNDHKAGTPITENCYDLVTETTRYLSWIEGWKFQNARQD